MSGYTQSRDVFYARRFNDLSRMQSEGKIPENSDLRQIIEHEWLSLPLDQVVLYDMEARRLNLLASETDGPQEGQVSKAPDVAYKSYYGNFTEASIAALPQVHNSTVHPSDLPDSPINGEDEYSETEPVRTRRSNVKRNEDSDPLHSLQRYGKPSDTNEVIHRANSDLDPLASVYKYAKPPSQE